ncbi:MAG: hypothetical protein OWQ57_10505 [Sulfobacillus sp.]|nr:hypothetical protein [Sulfobacillus sp.]
MACSSCAGGGTCYTIEQINSMAQSGSQPWYPEEVAQNILTIMSALGIDLYGMDAPMAVAAMNCQGCYTNPNSCFQYGYPQYCSPPTNGEGYGVLQDTYDASASPPRLYHSEGAYDEASSFNVQDIFFPAGTGITTNPETVAISPCTVVADPGIAFAEFYFWALTQTALNNCQTVGAWIGSPSADVSCAECSYTAYTGESC